MNNDNELHDVSFKIRYPNKKEKITYAVKSILIDELTILEDVITTYLKENGYQLISMTGEKQYMELGQKGKGLTFKLYHDM